MKIRLVEDTVNSQDIDKLVEWLKTYPRLTKGELTEQFEEAWSEWLGCKYSVFVNSGSSANLLMIYALEPKNKEIIVPAVSWATTAAPVLQLGGIPLLCQR